MKKAGGSIHRPLQDIYSYQGRNEDGTNFEAQPLNEPVHVGISAPTWVGVRVRVHSAGVAPVFADSPVITPVATSKEAKYCDPVV